MKPLDFLGTPIHLSRDFGSDSKDHRIKLRGALQAYVRDHGRRLGLTTAPAEIASLMDLTMPPRIQGWAISISHCPVAGGFIALPSKQPLGFDLEISSRLSDRVLERIAVTPFEKERLRTLPVGDSRAFFWVAKEAAIKAFGNADKAARPHFGDVHLTALEAEAKSFRAERDREVVRGTLFRITENEEKPLAAAIAQFDK